jgi:hypothetical protein
MALSVDKEKVVSTIVTSWCVPQGEQAVACPNCQHTPD